MRAVDVHGFGGGFTLGAVQAGWDLVGKMSRFAGFGVFNTMANRHLLGNTWESVATDPTEWEAIPDVQLVFGNPPCSGFSTLSPKHFRGEDSSINDCMWELISYAVKARPEMVIFESVQQTFRQGLGLMRRLHTELVEQTGLPYKLVHVLHNNASVGGVSTRKRYFWVATRVPFGIESCGINREAQPYTVDRVPQFADMLRDLNPLSLTMSKQPYRGTTCECTEDSDECTCAERRAVHVLDTSWWCEREILDGTGMVDGHDILRSKTLDRALDVLYDGTVTWEAGESMSDVLRKYWLLHNKLPRSWQYETKKTDEHGLVVKLTKEERLVETDFAMGHNQLSRWHATKLARVITGGACHLVLHPWQDRTLTQREAARIQGFPDDWRIWPVRNASDLGPGWGKGVPVQAGRWVAYWAKQSIEGKPGSDQGVPLAKWHKKLGEQYGPYDTETVIDITYDYRPYSLEFGDRG